MGALDPLRRAAQRLRSARTVPGVRRTLLLDWAIREVLVTETRSAVLLLLATAIALVWSNAAPELYRAVWGTDVAVSVGSHRLHEPLRAWISDGLMVVFFYVVGLELRRELERGELRELRTAAIPILGAVGGALLAPLLFLFVNSGRAGAGAWGTVVTTDTAFGLGILALVGSRAPPAVRVFLLSLAVTDDVVAVLIIAAAYSQHIDAAALALAALLVVAMLLLLRLGAWRVSAYLLLAVALWIAAFESGIHPVIVGVALGLLTPAGHPRGDRERSLVLLTDRFLQQPSPAHARMLHIGADAAVSPNERLQYVLRPWTSSVVMPLFALANAGVRIDRALLVDTLHSPLAWGITLGLLAGKTAGIAGASFAASLVPGWRLPGEMRRAHIPGVAAVSAIGFTMSLFIADLALGDPHQRAIAKLAILAAAVAASGMGWLAFQLPWLSSPRVGRQATELAPPFEPGVDHARGPARAPVTLVEFGDFECPYCADAVPRVAELMDRHRDRLRFVFRHLPVTSVHPRAEMAARAAEAAALQGAFWPMHDHLFAHQLALGRAEILASAAELGLDVRRFTRDLDSDEVRRRIERDLASADGSGVAGVPSFFVNGRPVPRALELLPRAVATALRAG